MGLQMGHMMGDEWRFKWVMGDVKRGGASNG